MIDLERKPGNIMQDEAFFEGLGPFALIQKFGSPLYVYNERVFRQRIREMKSLVSYPNFSVNYSVKANSNLTLLKIAREEGLLADAMSPGEMYVEEQAGFLPEEIFFISNNASWDEWHYAVSRGILVSIDSVSQLEKYGKLFPGTKVAIRVNSGVGAGHSDKVITGGHHTKFAILPEDFAKVKAICREHDLTVCGLNQHIGSFILEEEQYLKGVRSLLALAPQFEDLDFIDLGGGFGMPYELSQKRLDLASLGAKLDELLFAFADSYGKQLKFKIEPGRYISAECGVLLGTVNGIKENSGTLYCGTDVGFNVLIRPLLYDAYHEIETLPHRPEAPIHPYTVVGNICETGDILAKDRLLPEMQEDDLIVIHDAGAYGYSMASNYNNRLRPAEILITPPAETCEAEASSDPDDAPIAKVTLIRRRDSLVDLMRNFT